MSFFEKLKNKRKSSNLAAKSLVLPNAVAFIDCEHWIYSLHDQYKMRPDYRSWLEQIQERYTLADITFYGDFTQDITTKELNRIREVATALRQMLADSLLRTERRWIPSGKEIAVIMVDWDKAADKELLLS